VEGLAPMGAVVNHLATRWQAAQLAEAAKAA